MGITAPAIDWILGSALTVTSLLTLIIIIIPIDWGGCGDHGPPKKLDPGIRVKMTDWRWLIGDG